MATEQSITSFLPLQFERHQVRMSLDEHGRTWWVAADVCAILGLENTALAMRRLRDVEKNTLIFRKGIAGNPAMRCVNEPGLYRLIFRSNKPAALAFQDWLYTDVLPALRRTGTYTIPGAPAALTPMGQLPPPAPRVREHAEVSPHLLAVFCLLRDQDEWLTNHEIAQRTGIARRTARAHTRYLLQVGMIERQEAFPRHLHHFAPEAARRNAGVYQRLCQMAEILQARQAF